jgi:hypothetical protein
MDPIGMSRRTGTTRIGLKKTIVDMNQGTTEDRTNIPGENTNTAITPITPNRTALAATKSIGFTTGRRVIATLALSGLRVCPISSSDSTGKH